MEKKFVVIRTQFAGVHMGYLKECIPMSGGYYDITLENSRRIWSWSGANCLNDLSINGVKKPKDCKISAPIQENRIMGIEVLSVHDKAKKILLDVPEWNF